MASTESTEYVEYLEVGSAAPTLATKNAVVAKFNQYMRWSRTGENPSAFKCAFESDAQIPVAYWMSKKLYLSFLDYMFLFAKKRNNAPFVLGSIKAYGRIILNLGPFRVRAACEALEIPLPANFDSFWKILDGVQNAHSSWYVKAELLLTRSYVQELDDAKMPPLTETDKVPLPKDDVWRMHRSLCREGTNERCDFREKLMFILFCLFLMLCFLLSFFPFISCCHSYFISLSRALTLFLFARFFLRIFAVSIDGLFPK
jgi:hypothetical protein